MKNNKTIKIALTILTLGSLVGCTSRSGPPASVHYDKTISPYHVVKKGDSIASIARKYGMDKRELIRTNGLESPYRIVKGQRLLVRPHKSKSSMHDDRDESEMPATEEVSNVPEDDDVEIKPLAPVAGVMGVAGAGAAAGAVGMRGGAESVGRLNPEVDDEAEGEESPNRGKYDEDNIDDAEGRAKSGRMGQDMPAVPSAAGAYKWPVQGTVIQGFDPAKGRDGINIAAEKGTPVVAANNGVVVYASNQLRGFGNVVLIKHDNGIMTVYAHLDKMIVKKGQAINAGQQLGAVGQTGKVSTPQLHIEFRKGSKPMNPDNYLR